MQKDIKTSKTIYSVPLKGEISAPPSKSMAHRVLLAAALAKGKSVIQNITFSEDITATADAVRRMGAKVVHAGHTLTVEGIKKTVKGVSIDCAESGTTLRLLMPVLAALQGGMLAGRGRLPQRPVDEYIKIFDAQGLCYSRDASGLPIILEGGMKSGVFRLSGMASSQYVSGLMFALPLLEGTSEIIIEDALESSGYVDLTVQVLNMFGIRIDEIDKHRHYAIKGNQQYRPWDVTVEGDWSQAAFFLLAGLLSESLVIKGLSQDTCQKDRDFLSLLLQMGADITFSGGAIAIRKSTLQGITADVSQMPDIAPALAGAMCIARGKSLITGGKRLRIKESDRIKTTVEALKAIGADIEETEDGMAVNGKPALKGGVSSSHHDHRIAMTLAALAAACDGSITIQDSTAVNKSYPSFFKDYKKLGGIVK